jgi:YHS domain-containing protein
MTRYDLYERFAGEHLRTRAERVVYFTLVAQTRASWSAAEIAALSALDSPIVGAVLDGYEAAGIVEADESRPGRRYRWRSDMTYLFGDGVGGADLIDPVCGMRVAGDTPYSAVDAGARRWTFCSALCLAVFEATPEPCVPTALKS